MHSLCIFYGAAVPSAAPRAATRPNMQGLPSGAIASAQASFVFVTGDNLRVWAWNLGRGTSCRSGRSSLLVEPPACGNVTRRRREGQRDAAHAQANAQNRSSTRHPSDKQAAQHRDDLGQVYTPLLWNLSSFGQATSYVLPVLLRAGATVDMALAEEYSNEWLGGAAGYRDLAKVHAAGGWKRYAQAHAARLAPIFAKAFPHARLPPELVSHIVGLWAHVGYY